jgi:hypothetical protein
MVESALGLEPVNHRVNISHDFKGTVSPVLSRLNVVLLNIVESGDVPLVV